MQANRNDLWAEKCELNILLLCTKHCCFTLKSSAESHIRGSNIFLWIPLALEVDLIMIIFWAPNGFSCSPIPQHPSRTSAKTGIPCHTPLCLLWQIFGLPCEWPRPSLSFTSGWPLISNGIFVPTWAPLKKVRFRHSMAFDFHLFPTPAL